MESGKKPAMDTAPGGPPADQTNFGLLRLYF